MWIKAIRNGNYDTWPLINLKNVNKHFPESKETQYGHMWGQQQGVQSTKPKPGTLKEQQKIKNKDTETPSKSAPQQEQALELPEPEQNDIMIKTHESKTNTLYTNQMGKFPHVLSKGNRYQMIAHHTDTTSTRVEPMKIVPKEK